MSSILESTSIAYLSAAMDAAAIRHSVIATNIANANTSGYTAQSVSFEVALGTAWQSGASRGASVKLEPTLFFNSHGAVQIDGEMAAMAQNSAHYQVLARALNRELAVMSMAVSDGKR